MQLLAQPGGILVADCRHPLLEVGDEELAALRELGIQLGQGYLLGRPEPVPA